MKNNHKIFTQEQQAELTAALSVQKAQDFFSQVKEGADLSEFGTFKMLITTAAVDRMGESILLEGWDVAHYMNNPVVLAFHDYASFPIGATAKLSIVPEGMMAEGFFAPTDEGQKARKLYDLGFLKTASVGFMVMERSAQNNKIITKAQLLEWSFVPVPANPEALDQIKAAGLEVESKWIEAEETKEGEPVDNTKGAIIDELSGQDLWMEKYCLMDPVWNVVYAFCDVFFSGRTPTSDFGVLLSEMAEILKKIAEGVDIFEGDDGKKSAIVKAMGTSTEENIKKYLGIEEKSGKVLSDKSKKIIENAISAMGECADNNQKACDHLNELLAATDDTAQASGAAAADQVAIKPTAEVKETDEVDITSEQLLKTIYKAIGSSFQKRNTARK